MSGRPFGRSAILNGRFFVKLFCIIEKKHYVCRKDCIMIGYSYIRKPLSGERSKQIAQSHTGQKVSSDKKKTVKMPDKFRMSWK